MAVALYFADFKFEGVPLPKPPKLLKDCDTVAKKTAWVVQEILNRDHVLALDVLEKHKDVLRGIVPVDTLKDYISNEKFFNCVGVERAAGLAIYMFVPAANKERCNNCNHPNHEGPMTLCVAPGPAYMKGACTNCYYSGLGTSYSLRLAHEKQVHEAELAKRKEAFEGITMENLEPVPDPKLDKWEHILKEEIKAQETPETPTRKRKGDSRPGSSRKK